ncbi:MAG: hypothetical protein ACRC4G_06475 [Alphaproteobacteria bacterium]
MPHDPYTDRKIDSTDLLDLISESMFKMAFLMSHITKALEKKKLEDVCFLSEKGWEMLAALEGLLHQNEVTEEGFKDFIQFCQTMSVCLQKVNADTDCELSQQMIDSFKAIGVQFQKKQQEMERAVRQKEV